MEQKRSPLDAAIRSIVDRTAGEIASVVRSSVVDEVLRLVGPDGRAMKASAAATTTARRQAPAAPKGRSRAAATPKKGPPVRSRASRARGGAADPALLDQLLSFIKANPGKRTEEIRAALKLDSPTGTRGLAELREAGKVKTRGQRRTTTYFVA